MAVFQLQMFSPTLQTHTGVTVIIPTPDSSEMQQSGGMDYFCDGVKYQVLYLLHGLYGDHTNWLRYTSIERYVQDRRLAVVMPAVGNSFYQDMYHGPDYLTYITQELPRYICRLFPVSDRREDTFVAGLSMGGYGAVKCAFQCPEQYAACASLSGALDVEGLLDNFDTSDPRGMWWSIFKDPQSARTGEANLFVLAKSGSRRADPCPRCSRPSAPRTTSTRTTRRPRPSWKPWASFPPTPSTPASTTGPTGIGTSRRPWTGSP